jgi:sortase A
VLRVAIVSGLAVLGLASWAAIQPQKFEDADRSALQRTASLAMHPAKRVVHRGQLLGMLQVPRLGLAVPMVEGSDDESLDQGAGHIPETAFPGHHGNAGIAAHRDTYFRPLRFIRQADHIVITTPGGVYDYVVSGTEIVLPSDGRVLHRTRSRSLTLVTCYPFYYVGSAPKRFIVHAAGD